MDRGAPAQGHARNTLGTWARPNDALSDPLEIGTWVRRWSGPHGAVAGALVALLRTATTSVVGQAAQHAIVVVHARVSPHALLAEVAEGMADTTAAVAACRAGGVVGAAMADVAYVGIADQLAA